MSKRYAVLGISVVLALALAVPAFGGPSNPIASISASAKQTANKALKKAKAAQQTANGASATASTALAEAQKAQSEAQKAQSTANSAQSSATTAQTAAGKALTTAEGAKTTAEGAKTAAAAAEANANTRVKTSEELAESTASNTETSKFVSVSCPTGNPVLGGGFSVGGEAEKVTVSASEEQLYGGGWFVDANAISGTPTWSLTAVAVCGEQ